MVGSRLHISSSTAKRNKIFIICSQRLAATGVATLRASNALMCLRSKFFKEIITELTTRRFDDASIVLLSDRLQAKEFRRFEIGDRQCPERARLGPIGTYHWWRKLAIQSLGIVFVECRRSNGIRKRHLLVAMAAEIAPHLAMAIHEFVDVFKPDGSHRAAPCPKDWTPCRLPTLQACRSSLATCQSQDRPRHQRCRAQGTERP